MMTILITGATGTVGSKVVKRLAGNTRIPVARRAVLETRMPPPLIDGVLELHALGRAGRAAVVTSAVAELTGAPARGFGTLARAYAATWRKR